MAKSFNAVKISVSERNLKKERKKIQAEAWETMR